MERLNVPTISGSPLQICAGAPIETSRPGRDLRPTTAAELRSEGLNVEGQKRAEPCRKKEDGGDGIRCTRERIAHLNEDVKCFAANGRK